MGAVTLPPLDGPLSLHTAPEPPLSHQVQGQAVWWGLGVGILTGGRRVRVVGAVDIQVVIQIHLDGQIPSRQPRVGGVPVDDVSLGRRCARDVEQENGSSPNRDSSRTPTARHHG